MNTARNTAGTDQTAVAATDEGMLIEAWAAGEVSTDELRTRAEAGELQAQVMLAKALLLASPAEPSWYTAFSEACHWLRRASDAGSMHARGLLGEQLLHNSATDDARMEGAELLRDAAVAGDVAAARNYGIALTEGRLEPQADGAYWLEFAARSGDDLALALIA